MLRKSPKYSAFRKTIPGNHEKSIPANNDDFEYAERCAHWLLSSQKRRKFATQIRRDRAPIILNGNGASLRVDRDTLLIRNGFTHHPQQRSVYRCFRGDPNLPSRILMLDGSGLITFDVLSWLADQKIPFVILDWRGGVVTVASESGHSADTELVTAQNAAGKNGRAKEINRWLISEKLKNSIATLHECARPSDIRDKALGFIGVQSNKLANRNARLQFSILSIEAQSALLYFKSFLGMSVQWKGTTRRPVPADWYKVGRRTSALTELSLRARHPVNAMLNYGYAVLQSLVRTQIIAAGLDPKIGLVHKFSDRRRDDLVFDFMEPLRPIVDRVVFGLVRDEVFSPADFEVTRDGMCKLNPELARKVAFSVADQVAPREMTVPGLGRIFRTELGT